MIARTGVGKTDLVQDFGAIVHVRNCIAHNAGIRKDYDHADQLLADISSLKGVSLGNWHFFGEHVCIEKGALNLYIKGLGIEAAGRLESLLRLEAAGRQPSRHHTTPAVVV